MNDDESQIKTLKDNERLILLSEIGTLIHDIGKLHSKFIEKQSIESEIEYIHGKVLEYESGEDDDFPAPSEAMKNKATHLKNILENTEIRHYGEKTNLYTFVTEHHTGDNPFISLLKRSDKFDASEDRAYAVDKQSICETHIANAFGVEEAVDLSFFEDQREYFYELVIDLFNKSEDSVDIQQLKDKRDDFLKEVEKILENGLGMTARAANDVSLWEHSYMTSTTMKALIGESVISEKFPIVQTKSDIDEEKPFRILSVGWDYFEFLTQSQKIPDVIGRVDILDEIKEEIKNTIEIEYLLGNTIYEDDQGIHFLIPGSFDEKGVIEEEIYDIFNEKVNGIIVPYVYISERCNSLVEQIPKSLNDLCGKIQKKEMKPTFVPDWIKDWDESSSNGKFICNNCGKGYYFRGSEEEICETCKNLRKQRPKKMDTQTQFIDEISWGKNDYSNLALFACNFDLDNWLNGKYVKSLFMRKFDKKNVNFLSKYLKREDDILEIINECDHLGALIGWFRSEDEKAKNNAKKKIESIIEKYNEIDYFSKEYLNDLKNLLLQIKDAMELEDVENTKELLQKLNNTKDNLKGKPKEVENRILHSSDNLKKDERNILKNASSLEEILNKIFLKTPSPSRLMRVWNCTEQFFKDFQNTICENSPIIDRHIFEIEEEVKVTGVIEAEFVIDDNNKAEGKVIFDDDRCITVSPHINSFIDENKDNITKIDITDNSWDNDKKEYTVKKHIEVDQTRGYRVISLSPTQFIFLVPASISVKIAKKIQEHYMSIFGKVYGKLPLNVGIVYFKRKTPFFTVLDSAYRFKENLSKLSKPQEFEVCEVTSGKLSFYNSDGNNTPYTIKIDPELGNGETDPYHPFLIVKDERKAYEIKLENEKAFKQRHIGDIEKEDRILIHPSNFDFEYLDTTNRRFDISLKEKRRLHPLLGKESPRPYILEDIDKLQRLKKLFQEIGSWTPIRDIESLAASKREDWSDDEKLLDQDIFEKFISTVLENKLSRFFKKNNRDWKDNIKPFLKECIVDGSFFDAIDIYKSIMKIDMRGEENE